ncbi:hypothetical protein EP331_08940 [bacterium]|nr:MAG: hypothetical protein EP331_08940 [bacterium]
MRLFISIVKWITLVAVFTFVTGYLVDTFLIVNGTEKVLIDGFPLSPNYLASFVFTSCFFLINYQSGKYLLSKYPIVSWDGVSLHIWLQTTSALVAFTVASFINYLIFSQFETHKTHTSIGEFFFVLIMSMTAALLFNLAYYTGHFFKNTVELKRIAAESQLTALKNQINPHFLFNSLNSIASLIRINPEKAEEVTEDLAELFRYSLRSGQHHLTSIEEELDSIETYLRIEKARFGERIQYEKIVDDSLLDVQIPSLVLQPLIENSIKHAANKMTESCVIQLRITSIENKVQVSVTDNGTGFLSSDLSEIFQHGTGLKNVHDRLTMLLGEDARLQVEQSTVRFLLPLKHGRTP